MTKLTQIKHGRTFWIAAAGAALFMSACSSSEESNAGTTTMPEPKKVMFTGEVWADNWFGFYANGELVAEDSVPITTERSFNSETFEFEASYPLTIGIEAKDFKETDSGLEYIGKQNQQLGDGGLIAQVKDAEGNVVLVTDSNWSSFVTHKAPLNPECVNDANPDETCQVRQIDTPQGWAEADFNVSVWRSATEWTEADVSPKDGYDSITWDDTAKLIWDADLEADNTVLLRAETLEAVS